MQRRAVAEGARLGHAYCSHPGVTTASHGGSTAGRGKGGHYVRTGVLPRQSLTQPRSTSSFLSQDRGFDGGAPFATSRLIAAEKQLAAVSTSYVATVGGEHVGALCCGSTVNAQAGNVIAQLKSPSSSSFLSHIDV